MKTSIYFFSLIFTLFTHSVATQAMQESTVEDDAIQDTIEINAIISSINDLIEKPLAIYVDDRFSKRQAVYVKEALSDVLSELEQFPSLLVHRQIIYCLADCARQLIIEAFNHSMYQQLFNFFIRQPEGMFKMALRLFFNKISQTQEKKVNPTSRGCLLDEIDVRPIVAACCSEQLHNSAYIKLENIFNEQLLPYSYAILALLEPLHNDLILGLTITNANITEVPSTLQYLLSLTNGLTLNLPDLETIPDWINIFSELRNLTIKSSKITRLPQTIKNLSLLKKFTFNGNLLDQESKVMLEEMSEQGIKIRLIESI